MLTMCLVLSLLSLFYLFTFLKFVAEEDGFVRAESYSSQNERGSRLGCPELTEFRHLN